MKNKKVKRLGSKMYWKGQKDERAHSKSEKSECEIR